VFGLNAPLRSFQERLQPKLLNQLLAGHHVLDVLGEAQGRGLLLLLDMAAGAPPTATTALPRAAHRGPIDDLSNLG